MIGKTIASVRDTDGDLELTFTDGTGTVIEGTGWECDGCVARPLTATELHAAQVRDAEAEEATRRQTEAVKRERVEIARARASMTPDEFQRWCNERYGVLGAIMCQEFAELLEAQMRYNNRLLFG